ncbi:hypothetical protein AN959_10430 [Psychrobacillus sp. FJAT-21963]|nr:hypothetical protein AN959_10430 [Psychrobacillus sp. FJAT-21963]
MMELLKIRWLIWLFPIVFFIHDLEEILTVEYFSMVLPFKVTTVEFILAFSILWLIVFIGCMFAATNKDFIGLGPIQYFSILVAGIFLANGIGHILQSIFFQKYVPGVITSIFILVPFCLFSIKKLLLVNLITCKQILIYLALGFILQTPFAMGSIMFAKFIVKIVGNG